MCAASVIALVVLNRVLVTDRSVIIDNSIDIEIFLTRKQDLKLYRHAVIERIGNAFKLSLKCAKILFFYFSSNANNFIDSNNYCAVNIADCGHITTFDTQCCVLRVIFMHHHNMGTEQKHARRIHWNHRLSLHRFSHSHQHDFCVSNGLASKVSSCG